MKQYITLTIMFILPILLIGCQQDQGFTIEYDIDLDYEEYLSEQNPLIKMSIQDYGDIYIELFTEIAPITVDNFIAYIESESYIGSTFHRVINNFMIQGGIVNDTACAITGEFTANGVVNPLSHYPGVIAMARTGFPNSATSQFFINEVYNSFLNRDYAAFGGVVSGFNIVQQISDVTTNVVDRPNDDVIINSIEIDDRGYEPNERICHANV